MLPKPYNWWVEMSGGRLYDPGPRRRGTLLSPSMGHARPVPHPLIDLYTASQPPRTAVTYIINALRVICNDL